MSSASKTFPTCLTFFFFFNDTATTEIYTLSLHDALPISRAVASSPLSTTKLFPQTSMSSRMRATSGDRKSTRLNSSHLVISYAVFCLKKKMIQSTVYRLLGNYIEFRRHIEDCIQ